MDPLSQSPRYIHFVGIGGVGMSGIAEVLLNLGHKVTGSDIAESANTRRLQRLGADVHFGHRANLVHEGVDVVVISTAAKFSNPEVMRARELRVPVIHRAEMLAELMRMKLGVAVAGTHGKTTTTSLISAALHHGGLDPTSVIGGRLLAFGANAQLGKSDLMVAEADESDGSFLVLSPTLAVVTNIEREHLDHYGDIDGVKAAFTDFMNRVPFYGASFVCLDDVTIRGMLPDLRKRIVTYGVSADADYVGRNVRVSGMTTRVEVLWHGESLGEICVPMPGRHQALNALATVAVARHLGVEFEKVAEALAGFGGIHRRFEVRADVDDMLVVSDYAHHPSEIRATLEAAREGFDRRLLVVFEPHRYTRLRDLWDEFLSAFDLADRLYLTEVYPAGEDPLEGFDGEALYTALKRRGHLEVNYLAPGETAVEAARADMRPGDIVLVLGAGRAHKMAEHLVASLPGGSADAS